MVCMLMMISCTLSMDSENCPRPRPRGSGLVLGLGLEYLSSDSALASIICPRLTSLGDTECLRIVRVELQSVLRVPQSDVCKALMCKNRLSVKILGPLSVKAFICKNGEMVSGSCQAIICKKAKISTFRYLAFIITANINLERQVLFYLSYMLLTEILCLVGYVSSTPDLRLE